MADEKVKEGKPTDGCGETEEEAADVEDAEDEHEPTEPSLEEQLAQARAEAQEAQTRSLRALAELQNFKRRTQRDLADRLQYANEQILGDLISVVDHLRLALAAAEQSSDAGSLREGVELILDQLEGVMAKYGLTPVAAEGEKFDPLVHEAVERVESDVEDGTVVEEVKRGYRLHDRTLRPAQVKVAAGARDGVPPEEGEQTAEEK